MLYSDNFKEKRKWQIALRRYVIEHKANDYYAPYFGLDIKNMRNWFECQFTEGIGWNDFGHKWQFEHILPAASFDFKKDDELKLCWNFINLKVSVLENHKIIRPGLDIIHAKRYFSDLYTATAFPLCKEYLQKIEALMQQETHSTAAQQQFIKNNLHYITNISTYTSSQYSLLNKGKNITEIALEMEILKKFEG
ncbi:MAG TPA: hypothetical protein PKC39_02905 [Ferruginibacter sp.]|nr:hypothetical protein [Ferruginibacter sp.]HMP19887.1 hypothetical protein [Ferruginibacter sp.]